MPLLSPNQEYNPLNAELNPILHLLALARARHIVHVGRIRVKADHIQNYAAKMELLNAGFQVLPVVLLKTEVFLEVTLPTLSIS